jgi:hypothetical protein
MADANDDPTTKARASTCCKCILDEIKQCGEAGHLLEYRRYRVLFKSVKWFKKRNEDAPHTDIIVVSSKIYLFIFFLGKAGSN